MVHEDGGQTVADRMVHERRRNGGIHAARQGEQHFLSLQFFRVFLHGPVNEIVHRPVAPAMTDPEQEVLQQRLSVNGMRDFRMELHAVQRFFFIAHRGDRAVRRFCEAPEAFRQHGDVVRVAHPDRAAFRNAFKQYGGVRRQFRLSVFAAALRRTHFAAGKFR